MNGIGFMVGKNMMSWEPEKMCNTVRDLGYDVIELQSELLCGGNKSDADRRRMLRAVENAGLTVSEVVIQQDYVALNPSEREGAVERTVSAIKIIADCGIGIANLFTGPRPWINHPVVVGRDVSQGEAWGWVFEAYDRILPVAEQYKVRLAVENVWGMLADSLYTNMFLNRHYNSPWLGVNLDPSHDVLKGNTDMRFLVNAWGNKIFHVHLKDAVGIPVKNQFVFPLLGEGNVNWGEFAGALSDAGYQGDMSVEFESWAYLDRILGGRYELAAEISRKAVRQLIGR